jgi:hypothetical protein
MNFSIKIWALLGCCQKIKAIIAIYDGKAVSYEGLPGGDE